MKRAVIISAISLAVLGGYAFARYEINAPVKKFTQTLNDLNGITIGETTESDLLARPFFQKQEPMCSGADCFYHLEARNAFLSSFHLAPKNQLGAFVSLRNGVVETVAIIIWRQNKTQLGLKQTADMKDCKFSPCIRNLIPPNRVLTGREILYDTKSDIRNHLPQSVNPSCLARRSGCDNDLEVLPILGQLTPVQAGTTPAK